MRAQQDAELARLEAEREAARAAAELESMQLRQHLDQQVLRQCISPWFFAQQCMMVQLSACPALLRHSLS